MDISVWSEFVNFGPKPWCFCAVQINLSALVVKFAALELGPFFCSTELDIFGQNMPVHPSSNSVHLEKNNGLFFWVHL
jgi:hypothetical protein